MSFFVTYVFFKARKKKVNSIFVRFVFIGNGQIYFNFQYIYLKIDTLSTILDETLSAEIISRNFIIEVIIISQQHENI